MTDKKQLKEKKIVYPSFEEVAEINKYITTGKGNISQKQKDKIDKMNANLVPRDPKRIPEILDALRTIWVKSPDMRLGQLLLNFVFRGGDAKEKTNYLMYEQEDDLTFSNIEKKLKSEKKKRKSA